MPTLTPFDEAPTITEHDLQSLEQEYACRLPEDYRKFMLQNNGGFPDPNCFTFLESGGATATDVFCFFAIGEECGGLSLNWNAEIFSDRLPEQTLPIARDSCGNLWLLSVGGEKTGSVFFWDHGPYDTFDETDLENWPRVAKSFQEFQDRLGPYDASVEQSEVLSRYAMVNQANNAMVKQHGSFSSRENPDFVWHCDCDESGNVRLQFVQYGVHAGMTHTDGYTRLREIKGLIDGGPTRMPE